MPRNIRTGFRQSGVIPLQPMVPLSSQFAVDPPEPGLYRTVNTTAEINEMVLTWPDGLQKLAQIELKRPFRQEDEGVDYRRTWENLWNKTVVEGRPLSPPLPFYIRLDHDPSLIRELHIPNLPRQ
jgi:hypothetical protein